MRMGAACAGLLQPRAGLGGREANMEELGCMWIADVYGGCGNVWGRRFGMGAYGARKPMKIRDRAAGYGFADFVCFW